MIRTYGLTHIALAVRDPQRRFEDDVIAMAEAAAAPAQAERTDRQTALKAQALADPGVQSLLEVFPAEIRDVEEM